MFLQFFLMVVVGALIGGVTNYLAIVMLFRPHKAYYIGHWRIPFTPGMIPKRHAEIAVQFGRLVENYLLTETQVKELFLSPHIQEKIEGEIHRFLDRHLAHNSLTLREVIQNLPDEIEKGLLKCLGLENPERGIWCDIIARWLKENREKTLGAILALEDEQVEHYSSLIAERLVRAVNRFLSSSQGRKLLSEILESMFRQKNPFIRFLAGPLLQEEWISDLLLTRLQEAFSGWRIERRMGEQIRALWQEFSGRTVAELLGGMDEREAAVRLVRVLRLEERVADWMDEPVSVWGEKAAEWTRRFLPVLVGWLKGWLERNMSRLYAHLNLAGLVSSQVMSFPLSRLEKMILDVTAKELKAITLLGALLGGIIGLIQFFLVRGLG